MVFGDWLFSKEPCARAKHAVARPDGEGGMIETETKWHAQRQPTKTDPDDMDRRGLAAMDDNQAALSFHRWKKWNKDMQMARAR
jgi:hypothetical protein